MKNFFLIIIALLLLQSSYAQDKVLELFPKKLDNRNVEFSYIKNKPGSYTVVMSFTHLSNSYLPGANVFTVDRNRGALLTLKPLNKDQGITFSYSFRYINGNLNPKVNEEFCYILPYNAGRKVRVTEGGNIKETSFGAEKRLDWKNYFIRTNEQDTVTAIRKGLVVDIVDKYTDSYSEDVAFSSDKNQIIVEHEDGTLLRYSGFQGGSIAVKLGDDVLPGSVLGVNSLTENSNYSISLLLYYLNSVDFESLQGRTLTSQISLYKILTPKFTFDGTTCDIVETNSEQTVFNSEEIITRELSKKELKKYKAFKGNK